VRLLGNLDCEARWAGTTLPQRVLRKISAIASITAALVDVRDDEVVEVWAPAPVDPSRLVADPAWPRVVVRVGAPDRGDIAAPPADGRAIDLAWASPAAKPFNDRRFALAVEAQLGIDEPAARTVTSLDELERAVTSLDELERAVRAIGGPWVAKALWTTAGRDRCRGEGAPTGEQRVYLGRMLDRAGPEGHPDRALVVEPWRDRIVDVGTCACVTDDGSVRVEAPHTLLVDARGGFAGIDVSPPPLEPHEHEAIIAAVHASGQALAQGGYRGPFAVDSFVYADATGRRCVRAIVEINARHTFGHVARALVARGAGARLAGGARRDRDTNVTPRRLGFTPLDDAGRARARVLVEPTPDDATTAWLA